MTDATDPQPPAASSGSMTDEIMAQLSLPDLAARLGTDQDTARRAAEAALPTLLAGVTTQAADPQRSPQLARAVREDHDPAVLEAVDPVAHVDPDEGDRIVQHVFGDRRGDVEARLQGATSGVDSSLMAKLLPMLAPLVMAWLSRKMLGGAAGDDTTTGGGATTTGGGGGLGDVLGDVLGGGGGLGDVLGQLGGRAGKDGGLDDLLGSILGGGTSRG